MIRIALCFLLSIATFSVQAAIVPSPPQIAATAYLLVDANSGEVIAEHNADMPLPPASLTKMMTSYLLAEEINEGRVSESDMVTVSENAWSQNPIFKGSSLMFIEPRVPVSVDDLQRGVIISSGNDATVAVAEHIGGSESGFVEMMNAKAQELGMVDTYYVNPHGLPHPEHLTTTRDLAILSKAIIYDHPEQYSIYKERQFKYGIKNPQFNRNPLLAVDPTVDGLKTGHTEEAGYCLVASAERRGMRLIAVVMGTKSKSARKSETASLLNYGFRFFETSTVFEAMTELESADVWQGAADTVSVGIMDATVLTLPRGKKKHLVTEVDVDNDLIAPLAAGDKVGTVTLKIDGETVYHGPVVALAAVEQAGLFARLWDMFLMWLMSLLGR